MPSRSRERHVQQSSLLMNGFLGDGLRNWHSALRKSGNKDSIPFKALGTVHRGDGDRCYLGLVLVFGPLHEVIGERRQGSSRCGSVSESHNRIQCTPGLAGGTGFPGRFHGPTPTA